MLKFCPKIELGADKNYVLVEFDEFEFGDLEILLTAVWFKSNEFDKMSEKTPLLLFSSVRDCKIFAKMPYPSVKFNEKHDGEVGVLLRLVILEFLKILCKK